MPPKAAEMDPETNARYQAATRAFYEEVLGFPAVRCDIIKVKAVKFRVENDVGYMKITSFTEKTFDDLQNAILCEIERFEQGARATDDRTLLLLKREARA